MPIDLKLSSDRPKANFSSNFEEMLIDKETVVSLPMSQISFSIIRVNYSHFQLPKANCWL